jgi:hypothetical protein
LKAIGAATLPALEKLEIWFGQESYGGNSKIADVDPILDGAARFPALRDLGLRNAPFADALAARVGQARIVKQLKRLDLSKGTMRASGAQALVAAAPALKHLDELDVSESFLVADDLKALKKAFGGVVRTVEQRELEDWMMDDGETECHYTAVGE